MLAAKMDTACLTDKQDRHASAPMKPAGLLLSKYSLIFLLAVFIYAGLTGASTVVMLIAVILAASGLAKLWSRISLLGIEFRQTLNRRRIFPGEFIDWSLVLTNRKPLPLPWIQVETALPPSLKSNGSHLPDHSLKDGCLSYTTALWWYRSILWRHRIRATKRGYYLLCPVSITSGDMFGLYANSYTVDMSEAILVYPKIYPIEHFDSTSLTPAGENRTENQHYHDPTRPIGVRDYCPGDSLRQIHWKASARHQKLQVKLFESTVARNSALLLDVESFHKNGSCNEDHFETAISMAASLAYHRLNQGDSVGLFINTRLADSKQAVSIKPGSHQNQINEILAAFAKTTSSPKDSFEEFIERERTRIPFGTKLVMVVDTLSDALYSLADNLRSTWPDIVILQTGNREIQADQNRIPAYHISIAGNTIEIKLEASR
jgi:uncharacterized protein (DUF58 family)